MKFIINGKEVFPIFERKRVAIEFFQSLIQELTCGILNKMNVSEIEDLTAGEIEN